MSLEAGSTKWLEDEKRKELIILDFEKIFLPMDKTSRAWAALADLHIEGTSFKGDFHGFYSAFELEAGKSGVVDKNILKDMLQQAVSTDLAFKMTFLENELKMYKDWLTKAGHSLMLSSNSRSCILVTTPTYVPSGGY